ncbi:hypothetical protein NITLEN_11121 [Nitrospira lenta]|uniref:Uncharacterized protein n=1 Tax=Nitrospira lenta TaxID=1436998 RepID=A0A330L2Q8_9BACT|nr:hypothetical protein NITLEN_11121 [Nitrospira lenta]
MTGVGLKGDLHVSLQGFAKACFDAVLFCRRECRGARHGDLLSPLGLIDEFPKGVGDLRKKSDTIFLHELGDKRFADRRTPESAAEIGQHGNLFFHAEYRGCHHVTEGDGVLHGLGQAIESTPRRFDSGGIEKLKEGFGITSRNCCLNHGPCPITSTMGTRIIVVPSALK